MSPDELSPLLKAVFFLEGMALGISGSPERLTGTTAPPRVDSSKGLIGPPWKIDEIMYVVYFLGHGENDF